MIINHNIPALIANNSLSKANLSLSTASERLSTGYRINSASDDPAGLAISDKMAAQIRGLSMAERNAEDAQSLISTADSGLDSIENMVQRLRELAVEGSNGVYSTDDLETIQAEVDELIDEINDTSEKIQFNTKNLLDGSTAKFVFQIGGNTGLNMDLKIDSVSAMSLGYTSGTSGGEDYYTYTASYNTYDDEGNISESVQEEVTIRSLASLSSNYSKYYAEGVADTYEILENQYASLNSYIEKYESLIADGVDPDSAEAIKALSEVNEMYTYIEETIEDLNNIIGEIDYGTHDLDDEEIDVSSAVEETTSALDDFSSALASRISTLRETGVDSEEADATSALESLKTALDDTLIPASEEYYEAVDDGYGVYASQEGCSVAILVCDNVLSTISSMRAVLGAALNRLDYTISSLETSDDNLQNALSRVQDADMAEEMMNYSTDNILVQAGISILSQANQRPSQILSLLQ